TVTAATGNPERQTNQFVTAGRNVAQVQALQNYDAARQENLVRLEFIRRKLFNRQVVDAHQSDFHVSQTPRCLWCKVRKISTKTLFRIVPKTGVPRFEKNSF